MKSLSLIKSKIVLKCLIFRFARFTGIGISFHIESICKIVKWVDEKHFENCII